MIKQELPKLFPQHCSNYCTSKKWKAEKSFDDKTLPFLYANFAQSRNTYETHTIGIREMFECHFETPKRSFTHWIQDKNVDVDNDSRMRTNNFQLNQWCLRSRLYSAFSFSSTKILHCFMGNVGFSVKLSYWIGWTRLHVDDGPQFMLAWHIFQLMPDWHSKY